MNKPATDVLLEAARLVSTANVEAVFDELTRGVTELLGCDVGLLGRYVIVDDVPSVEVISCYACGRFLPLHTYPLAGTPCETVVGQAFRFYPRNVGFLFPAAARNDSRIESYAAYPLFDRGHEPLGVLTVMSFGELDDPEIAESLLRIFSGRAVAELEHERSATALRVSEAQYRAIFNASLDGLVLTKPDGTLVDVNPAVERMYGFSRDELLGRDVIDFLARTRRTAGEAFLAAVLSEGYAQTEDTVRRKDGSLLHVEPRGVMIDFGGEPHVLTIVRDITDSHDAERQRQLLEGQLRQAQKMEAIGHLTGGIAHDFNNILTSVLGYVELASDLVADTGDDRLNRYLVRARRAGERARDLVQQMLTFSRGQQGEPRAVHLRPIIEEGMNILEATMPATITLEKRLDGDLPQAVLDPVHLEQVLVNLCINARDAMHGSGTLQVTLRRAPVAEHVCASCHKIVPDRCVELAVSDTGPGLEPALVERVFEPFFSTKEVGKGSGMGLSTVHGIVHEYGGHVVVDTMPGEGASFRVFLPALEDPATVAGDLPAPREAAQGFLAGRVLLVDDNISVGEFLLEVLSDWGLDVVPFTDGAKALEFFGEAPESYDLVILDQTMPGRTGFEIACDILAQRPQLGVVLYTGYSETLSPQQVRDAGIRALVRKPLDLPAFRDLLAGILAG